MAVDPFGLSGQIVDGQFRVGGVIGEGGFSVVYRAQHLGLDEPVALKCLKLQPDLDAELVDSFAKRFRDESRIAYRLSQGNLDIIRSIAAGSTRAPSNGVLVPYMILEWLEGRSLGLELRERRMKGMTGRTLEETIELFDPAAKAVAYAHTQGIVHRDLKPGNLFLTDTRQGVRLKVLDFGLAKIVDEGMGIVPSVQTLGHNTICSPSYGAPEQFDPGVGRIGPWTDVYALGLLVLELLRDKKVRTGDGLAQCAIQALDPRRQPSLRSLGVRVRPQVELILAQAIALDPGSRHKDAGDFWNQLKAANDKRAASVPNRGAPVPQVQQAQQPQARPAPQPQRAPEPPKKDELASTRQLKAQPVPRDAFPSDPGEGGLGGTLRMRDAPLPKVTRPAAAPAPQLALQQTARLPPSPSRPPGPAPAPAAAVQGRVPAQRSQPPVSAAGDAWAARQRSQPPVSVPAAGAQAYALQASAHAHAHALQPQPAPLAPPPRSHLHGPPNHAYGRAGVISSQGSYASPATGPRSATRRKPSRAPLILFLVFLILALLAGGGFAVYRFVLVPRGMGLSNLG